MAPQVLLTHANGCMSTGVNLTESLLSCHGDDGYITVWIVGPLPTSLALRAGHGLSAAAGLPFLTFMYPS